jgi:two-component system sensor histidine kinase VicK
MIRLSTTVTLLFATYIILSGIMSGYIAVYDLSNLTLYLVALITIGVICIFEYEDTIMLTILTEVLFTIFILLLQADPTNIIYAELTSFILLSGFYLVSRYIYSYRANHYVQLLEIREKNEEIEKASAFKNDVLGMVAHDLRNPIAAIESISMIMQLDEIDEDTHDNLNMIKASCVKARSIINDLLEVARNDNSNVLETDIIELNQLLKGFVNDWRAHHKIKNSIILVTSAIPVYARINTEKFHRVIDNLVSNAIKFSKENDKIELYIKPFEDEVAIEVTDHGLGIPPEILPHIFERFSKAGRKGVRGESSIGLGLSIVRQIIEKHKGKIEVDSEVMKGSTFRITLPVVGH